MTIPNEIDPNEHGIHLEPCYKKFMLIISREKKRSLDSADISIRPKRSKPSDGRISRDGYPKECNLCNKYRIMRNGKYIFPITISTPQAVNMVKDAAEAKEDQKLFFEIKDLDLIAKEFKYHDACCREYTRKSDKVQKRNESHSDIQETGNFEAVVKCIEDKIIGQNQAFSMSALHDLHELHTGETRYRSKLKNRIPSAYTEKLFFLRLDQKMAEVVVSSEGVKPHYVFNDHDQIIKQAADHLRNDILEYAKRIPELNWPPCLDELNSQERLPPDCLTVFITHLLIGSDQQNSESVGRLIQSYASDLIYGVTRGNIITAKHFLLGLGLHNMTGQKKPVEITHHLGHSIDYKLVCEIETALAEAAQILATESGALPAKPASNDVNVLTFFWADNFDMTAETQTGKGSIHSTHMVAFQEHSQSYIVTKQKVETERTRRKSLQHPEAETVTISADPKKELSLLLNSMPSEGSYLDPFPMEAEYLVWAIFRKINAPDQVFPSYSTWKT